VVSAAAVFGWLPAGWFDSGWLASTLLAGERGDERKTANVATATTPAKASKIHTERLRVEFVRAGCAGMGFFFFMRTFVPVHKYAEDS